jgi:hypothetical protein
MHTSARMLSQVLASRAFERTNDSWLCGDKRLFAVPQQVANINSKDIVYIGHHLSSTYAPLARNNFMGCSERWGQL